MDTQSDKTKVSETQIEKIVVLIIQRVYTASVNRGNDKVGTNFKVGKLTHCHRYSLLGQGNLVSCDVCSKLLFFTHMINLQIFNIKFIPCKYCLTYIKSIKHIKVKNTI